MPGKMKVWMVLSVSLFFLFACGGSKTVKAVGTTGSAGTNPFAGNWTGIYTGMESGTWVAVIQDDGRVSATAMSPSCGKVSLVGRVTSSGALSVEGAGSGICTGFRIGWQGNLRIENGRAIGSGTWQSSSGYGGTWQGHRQ